MPETFVRGLRSIERIDRLALLQLHASPSALALLSPAALSLTLTPSGEATILLPTAALTAGLHVPRDNPGLQIQRSLCAVRVSGVCMSGAENHARRICACLAREGITLYTLSLSDLGLLFAVSEADADRAFSLVDMTVPLSW